jgi:hypothetical protein
VETWCREARPQRPPRPAGADTSSEGLGCDSQFLVDSRQTQAGGRRSDGTRINGLFVAACEHDIPYAVIPFPDKAEQYWMCVAMFLAALWRFGQLGGTWQTWPCCKWPGQPPLISGCTCCPLCCWGSLRLRRRVPSKGIPDGLPWAYSRRHGRSPPSPLSWPGLQPDKGSCSGSFGAASSGGGQVSPDGPWAQMSGKARRLLCVGCP